MQDQSTSRLEVQEMDTSTSAVVTELRVRMAAMDKALQIARQFAARQAGEVREYACWEDRNASSLRSLAGSVGATADSLERLGEYDERPVR